jgi:hypothetical protein
VEQVSSPQVELDDALYSSERRASGTCTPPQIAAVWLTTTNSGYSRSGVAYPPKHSTSLGAFTLPAAKVANSTKSAKNFRSAIRTTCSSHPNPIEIPDLLSLQTESFDCWVINPAMHSLLGVAKNPVITSIPPKI